MFDKSKKMTLNDALIENDKYFFKYLDQINKEFYYYTNKPGLYEKLKPFYIQFIRKLSHLNYIAHKTKFKNKIRKATDNMGCYYYQWGLIVDIAVIAVNG